VDEIEVLYLCCPPVLLRWARFCCLVREEELNCVGTCMLAACASCGAAIAGLAMASPLAANALAMSVGFLFAVPLFHLLFFFSFEEVIDAESESLLPGGLRLNGGGLSGR